MIKTISTHVMTKMTSLKKKKKKPPKPSLSASQNLYLRRDEKTVKLFGLEWIKQGYSELSAN